ncbi:pepsin/retropepsin-like aspartic protease family protein [Cognaticolwellia beringensis]|uniref:Signal protein PDZ n=1 Tax=Cognaticolwellia beringensis TaxID=1967665 RepID=A0A222G4L6_9GAMM|nr:pepsin/retropepsin-like aspartic protease family protein [Cognaticolwellia beringensis]ASP46730.1 signal protein PDZ [Cognaticolwellia beringensis]
MKILLSLTFLLLTLESTAGVTQWIDFNLDGGHVKIPATIAGIDTYAILDTGAQLNAINKAFIAKHNLTFDKGSKIRVKGVFGTDNKTTFNNVPVGFFGIETELDKMTEVSLGYHTNGFLLGGGFFDQFVTQLDYPNKRMRIISPDSIDVAKFKNIEIKSQKGTGMPIVKIGLPNDKHLWLLFDTGNSGGMVIERKVANKMGWLDELDSQATVSMGVNSVVETESFRIPSLKFGPFELENVLVTIPAEGNNSNLESQYQKAGSRIKGKKVQGIIGYDVLKHFLITIDYKGGYAHIALPEA